MPRARPPSPLKRRLIAALLVLGALAGIVLMTGMRSPEAFAQAGQRAAETAIRLAAPRLATWIASRRDALAPRCLPPPPQIARQLTPYFPSSLLEAVRFCVGWSRETSGAPLLMAGTRAMTLDHVIVFRDQAIATDPVIWAHELAHVRQYEQWGVPGFSERYLRDWECVEAAAWQVAADYKMWALETGRIE
jgi:hypothetical protein